jgi:hypothetical protein
MAKYLRISSYIVLGSTSSYMTLQLLLLNFLYMRKIYFLFYQCSTNDVQRTYLHIQYNC